MFFAKSLTTRRRQHFPARYARKDARTTVLAMVLGSPQYTSAGPYGRESHKLLTAVLHVLHAPRHATPTGFDPHAGRTRPEYASKTAHGLARNEIRSLLPECAWEAEFQGRLLALFAKLAPAAAADDEAA